MFGLSCHILQVGQKKKHSEFWFKCSAIHKKIRAYHSKLEINLGQHGVQPPTVTFSDLQDFSWEIRIKPNPTIKKTWLIVVSQFFMNVIFGYIWGVSKIGV